VENAVQALEAIKSLKPDLAIVDITLKEGSGLELIKDIKAQFASLPTLVFSMHDESLFAERALEAGALGYVMKEEPTETIIVAIRRVLDGDIYLSEQMIDRLLKKVGNAHGQAVQSPIQVLTDRQFEIFNLYGQGKGTREIAELLLGPKVFVLLGFTARIIINNSVEYLPVTVVTFRYNPAAKIFTVEKRHKSFRYIGSEGRKSERDKER